MESCDVELVRCCYYMCPHTTICVLIVLCRCPQTTTYVSSYYSIYTHTPTYLMHRVNSAPGERKTGIQKQQIHTLYKIKRNNKKRKIQKQEIHGLLARTHTRTHTHTTHTHTHTHTHARTHGTTNARAGARTHTQTQMHAPTPRPKRVSQCVA